MNYYLVPALERTIGLMRDLFKEFTPSEYDIRPDPERFSLREVICHEADWEPIMLTRIKAGVDKPGCTITAYDEVKMAADHDYASKDPVAMLDTWEADRKKTIEYVRTLTDEQLAHPIVHPERGHMTVSDIAHMIVCHDLYHLEQVSTMRKHPKVVDTW